MLRDTREYVESIPFPETREYVSAISCISGCNGTPQWAGVADDKAIYVHMRTL